MDPLEYYLLDEYILNEKGDGTCTVSCPYCQACWELPVDSQNSADRYACEACGGIFEIDWPAGQVRYNPE